VGEAEKPAAEPSLEPSGDAVKEPQAPLKSSAPTRAFVRHFEGWELGAIAVGLVLAAAMLAVPRAAAPGVFPVPLIDAVELKTTRLRRAELADRAEREGLPFETRAVGDALRRLGLVLSGEPGDAEHLRRVLGERVGLALAAKQRQALVRLCAVQTRLFVRAVEQHRYGATLDKELAALGGDFVKRATHHGWFTERGWYGSEDELRTLFTMRWLELTRLRSEPELRPTLAEWRRYYRFLMLYPERGPGADPPQRERAQMRLRYVEALARHDRDYPAGLARGSLLGELGDRPQSAEVLSQYLARSTGSEWALRGRNYLLHAAAGYSDEP
jgi:hypothetical protein